MILIDAVSEEDNAEAFRGNRWGCCPGKSVKRLKPRQAYGAAYPSKDGAPRRAVSEILAGSDHLNHLSYSMSRAIPDFVYSETAGW